MGVVTPESRKKAERKARLEELLKDESKMQELENKISELSKSLDQAKSKLDSIEKKKTTLLGAS